MGANVLKLIAENSGLPASYAQDRLEKLLKDAGFDPQTADLSQIREVLAMLLQDLILESDAEGRGH